MCVITKAWGPQKQSWASLALIVACAPWYSLNAEETLSPEFSYTTLACFCEIRQDELVNWISWFPGEPVAVQRVRKEKGEAKAKG